jgi:arylsulfatase A-like enzyme
MERLLRFLCVFCTLCGSSALHAAPNVIVILADDAGYADFGFQGGGMNGDFADLTPNIDSIATGGVRFSQGYANAPVCTPTRAGLLTGRYQSRFGVETVYGTEPNVGMPTTEKTIADTLKASGYRTYAIGKWHLGEDLAVHHPNQRGFDEYFGHLSGGRTYFHFTGASASSKLQRNGTFITETAGQPYLTDRFGSEAAAYIDSHATNHPTQPFFMYLAFNGVHTPLEADAVRLADPRIQDITVPERKTLAAMTIALDDAVGTVLAKLTQRGLMNDTLIVFTSDNGGPEDKESLNAPNWSDNGPLREGKTLLYEGGIRVPFVIKWPAGIAPALVGTTMADVVSTLDLLPTFVAAANGSLLPGQTTDGMSLLPRLNGTTTAPLQRCHFWRSGGSSGGQSAVRQGDWKLWRNNSTGAVELYNLASDLGETTNLAASNPVKVAELTAAHAEWESEMVEPLWGGGAPTFSNANLVRNPSTTGYELEKTGTGYSYMANAIREPLSLTEDWELAWTMDAVSKTGYSRNGSIVLGDRLQVNRFIRISLGFGSGAASITELQNNNATSSTWAAIPTGTAAEFRLKFNAATRTLTFRYGTNTLSHVVTGTYDSDVLDFAGYALQSSALTRFSNTTRHLTPRAPATTPTWARMKVARDYTPGTYDVNSNFMGGTEVMWLVAHKGQLFAGIGYWNDVFFGAGSPDPHPGAQVLVKESRNAPWRQDYAGGQSILRLDNLKSFTFSTDKNGNTLNPSVNLLLASSGELPPPYGPSLARRPIVRIRDDASGTWTPTYPAAPSSSGKTTRVIVGHIDSVTGIHHIFAGYGDANNTLVRGGYNAATGLIDWESATPELTGTERMLSAGECNGVLYACIGSNGIEGDNIGGIFWREDGPNPQWHFVHEWPLNGTRNPDIRGFTAVPHPQGFGHEVALVTLESFGKVYRIDPVGGDPRNGHIVTEDLNIQTFLGDEWNGGASIGFPTLSAYNDMPEIPHPATGKPVRVMGIAVAHPDGFGTEKGNSTYYLLRHLDATYEWGRIFDPTEPLPNNAPGQNGLRATRSICISPFPEDGGRVLYFGGFDAGPSDVAVHHNTAWIYRGALPDETPQIQRTGTNVTLPIDTAHGWQYQLRYSPDLSQWFDLGSPLNGNNASQSQLVTPAPGTTRQFYRWGISRP